MFTVRIYTCIDRKSVMHHYFVHRLYHDLISYYIEIDLNMHSLHIFFSSETFHYTNNDNYLIS